MADKAAEKSAAKGKANEREHKKSEQRKAIQFHYRIKIEKANIEKVMKAVKQAEKEIAESFRKDHSVPADYEIVVEMVLCSRRRRLVKSSLPIPRELQEKIRNSPKYEVTVTLIPKKDLIDEVINSYNETLAK